MFIDSETGYIESAGWDINSNSEYFLAEFGQVLTDTELKKVSVHYAAEIVTSGGINIYDNGRAVFYAKLKEVLTDLGQEELIKFIGA